MSVRIEVKPAFAFRLKSMFDLTVIHMSGKRANDTFRCQLPKRLYIENRKGFYEISGQAIGIFNFLPILRYQHKKTD